jgi:adenylate cyclase
MSVGLRVERVDLGVAGGAVEAGGLAQGPVGLEPEDLDAALAGVALQLVQEAAPDTEPACAGRHPHALDLRPGAVELQRSATDGLVPEPGDEEQARGLGELGGVGGEAPCGIEPGVEAGVELGDVRAQAELRRAARGVLDPDRDEARGEQPLDDAHRVHEPGALRLAERCQQRRRQLVAAPIQQRSFGAAGGGEARGPHPPVVQARLHHDQPVPFERAQQAAQIAGVQAEPEGLLEGLEDDASRAARRRLLDELDDQGTSLEELKRLVAEDKLVLAPVSRLLSSEERYTAREVAELSGVEVGMLAASWRALGLPVPGLDQRVFGEHDLEAAKLAHRYAAVAGRLLPLAGPWLQHVYATHLQQVLRTDAITQEQRRTGRTDDAQEAVVAFADLVGFTELRESVPVEELGSVAGRLSHLAGEACDPPVRIVKLIGDAVMLVSPEPAAMLDCTLRLVDLAQGDEAFPPLRAGIASGQAVHRWADQA